MSIQEFELFHPGGVSVSRRLTERELVGALPSLAATRRDMNTGWVWYSLPTFPDGDVRLSIALAFDSGLLSSMQISDANSEFGTDWGSWSEGKEHARVASVAKWLVKRGYPPGHYPWGEVWATYDPRSAGGSGGVRYI
jgi:hypothetical protein